MQDDGLAPPATTPAAPVAAAPATSPVAAGVSGLSAGVEGAQPASTLPTTDTTTPAPTANETTATTATAANGTTAATTNSSGNGSSANILLSTIRPLTIEVNETEGSVWVDSGVITQDLLSYLGSYVTRAAPAGYTLPAFPWFVYQSIGGAAATATHGSSLKWGSLSNQVLALDVVLADGSRRVFTKESDPFLMKVRGLDVSLV